MTKSHHVAVLSLFLRYIANIQLYELIGSVFLLKIVFGGKGLNLQQFLKQIFAYFMDGTDMSISGFDKKKEGCEVTYKKKKGFQPLHITWGPFLIDVLFRNGKAHSNHGTDYTDRVKTIVELIRNSYSSDVPIILCADSGFADQKAFDYFDTINVHFITTSRIYKDIKEYSELMPSKQYEELAKDKLIWRLFEFASKRGTWKRFRRNIFTTLRSCK